jgi:hypothetical protein
MSYAYYQGQEAQALAYYKKLLEVESDAAARQKLADLIAKLQIIVDAGQSKKPSSDSVVQNAVAA